MALDCSRALGAWFQRGAAVRVGLRMGGTRNAGTDCSAEEAGRGGVLSICAKPDVARVLPGMGRAVGGLRMGEPGCDRGGVRDCAGHGFVSVALRGANASKDVWRGV